MNANAKASQPVSDINSKSSVPPSMLLPDGVLDFSDDLSQEDDDLLHDDSKEFKSKRRLPTSRETEEVKVDGNVEGDAGVSKLRIKTGGIIHKYHQFRLLELFFVASPLFTQCHHFTVNSIQISQ